MASYKDLLNDATNTSLQKQEVYERMEEEQGGELSEEHFLKFFSKNTLLHVQRLVEDTITNITDRQAFFTERQLSRSVLRLAQKRMDEKDLEKKELVDLVEWMIFKRYLIEVGSTGKLTTAEMFDMEQSMLELAGAKDKVYIQPQDVFERAIARKEGISDEQTQAVVASCLSDKRVTVVEGSAGAGKSFTMQAVKEIYEEQGWDVIGTALGWAAAKVLGESAKMADEKCVAIEGLTRGWIESRHYGISPFTKPTLVIVDEAGMVGTRHMSIILKETAAADVPVKVVLTGDSLQVIPVNAGAALDTIIDWHGTTRIETIRRQHQASHRKSVYRFSQHQSGQAINTFLQQESFKWCKNKDVLINRVAQGYVSYKMAFPDKKALVLALSNKDVLELNFRIRAAYKKLGLIGKEDVALKVTNGIEDFEANFSVGDDIVLRANDKEMIVYEIDEKKSPLHPQTWTPLRLGVFNRYNGRIVAIQRSKENLGSYDLTIDLQGENPGRVVINSEKFGKSDFTKTKGLPMVHNYATTIYGSQGQTVQHVFLVDSERMDFRLSYVGMSRHKESVDVYLDETDLHRRLDKGTQKRQSLDSKIKMMSSGKSIDDVKVDIGRYTRSEMLRCVSLAWGKHSENLTCAKLELLRKRPMRQIEKEAETLAKIEPASLEEDIVDFIPKYNQSYPLVDMEKILALPDPLDESELVRPSDVEENKKRYASLDFPIDVENTPLPQPRDRVETKRDHVGALPTSKDEGGFFSRFFSKDKIEKNEKVSLRHDDVKNPFEDVEGVDDKPEEELSDVIIKKLNMWLNPKAKIDPPIAVSSKPIGQVIFPQTDEDFEAKCIEDGIPDPRPHGIDFSGVPQIEAEGGPSFDFVSSQRLKLWDVGKGNEARILAKTSQGRVVARYRLDGSCVVGEGFPPVCVNQHADLNTPVYIVSGAKEWFWLREVMEEKYKDTPEKIPHCIWAAKDVDWGLFKKSLQRAQKVVIVRSKIDDRQIPWAQSLQDVLKKINVNASVSPNIPVEPAPTTEDFAGPPPRVQSFG